MFIVKETSTTNWPPTNQCETNFLVKIQSRFKLIFERLSNLKYHLLWRTMKDFWLNPEQELKKECIFNEPFDREVRQVFLHGTMSFDFLKIWDFQDFWIRTQYEINCLAKFLKLTFIPCQWQKVPRNESLDQRPPAYHDNKSFGGKPKPLLGAKREAWEGAQ